MGVRDKLDAVYGATPEDSAVEPQIASAQARFLPPEKWWCVAVRSSAAFIVAGERRPIIDVSRPHVNSPVVRLPR